MTPQTLPTEFQAEFERNGFLVMRGLYSPEEITAIRETFMKEAENGPVAGLSEMRHGTEEYDRADPLAFYPRMLMPHEHAEKEVGRIARNFLLDPRLYTVLKALFGDEPLAAQTMFYFKPAGARGQALHQDNFYLRVQPGTCIAAWLAVDDADAENGGMVVVPGSNALDIVCPECADPSRFFTTELVSVPDGLHEEPVTLKAGDMLFFNGSVIHGSYPNSSKDRFRRSLIAHYVPKSTAQLGEWYNALTFSGEPVAIPTATGGGPCGTPQLAMGRH